MQSTPLVDIDFICWGPFNDPTTMCDSLTAPYIVDCSYSPAPTEICNITGAVTGQYYVLLITNYSNSPCNIDFSQTGGNATTNCCILGDAGIDNTIEICDSDSPFIMENQLNGNPNSGGVWYNNNWIALSSNTYNPSSGVSGTFAYIVQGTPVPGSTVTCPEDTSYLTINMNPDPIINFPALSNICSNDNPINLNSATPIGGAYTGNGITGNTFTPSTNIIGNNTITYSYTDASGCSNIATQNIIVNDVPSLSLGSDSLIPCRATLLIDPLISGGQSPYTYLWSDGSTNSTITVEDGIFNLILTDANNCITSDDLLITMDVTPIASISGGGSICNDGSTVDLSISFNGLLPWDLTYTNGSISSFVPGISLNNYTFSTNIAGQYGILLAEDINDCEADTVGSLVEVIVNPLPSPVITPNFYEIYPGEEIELSAGSFATYWWYNTADSLLSENEVIIADSTLIVYIVVESDKGCIGTSANAIVEYIPRVDFFIPNSFTPNDDEHNEHFVIKGLNIVHFNIQIFTRWGQLVFESNSIDKYWDGLFENNRVPEGSYYYQIDVLGEDKKSFTKGGMIQVIY
jgi:gliding motility-associated-like protein